MFRIFSFVSCEKKSRSIIFFSLLYAFLFFLTLLKFMTAYFFRYRSHYANDRLIYEYIQPFSYKYQSQNYYTFISFKKISFKLSAERYKYNSQLNSNSETLAWIQMDYMITNQFFSVSIQREWVTFVLFSILKSIFIV